jgi:[ribosomal protein S5]-alanine N-acetyltransferase
MSAVRIDGPRLSLVPFESRFLTQEYVDWLNDPALMRFSEQRRRQHTLESNAIYAAGFDHMSKFLWAIVDRRDESHIGNINAYLDTDNRVADIGLLVGNTTKQGQGLGTEAWEAIIQALLFGYEARKVTGGCAATNMPMRRIMERANMRPDGIRSQHLLIDGLAVDVIHMACFQGEIGQDRRYTIAPYEPANTSRI